MSKLTVKQEKFCQKYVELGDASAAYRAVYSTDKMRPATINRSAKALLDDRKITARIEMLRKGHQQRHNLTIDTLTEQIEEARALALKKGNPAAAVSACLAKAKLHGLVKRPRDMATPIELQGTLQEQGEQIIAAMGKGNLTPSDAAAMLNALTAQSRIHELVELTRRIEDLENRRQV